MAVNSEDLIGNKFDKCLTDGLVKLGGGFALGAVFSLLFFRRRRWPLVMGSGVGLGMAYASCETSINEVFKSPTFKNKEGKTSSDSGEILLSKKEK